MRASGVSIAFVALATSSIAFAQTEPDKALAESLFQEGRTLAEEGRVAEACKKFAESQRVEPKIGTLLNLATCHEEEGRTASAWAEFREAGAQAERAHQTDRVEFARAHAEALERRLSHLLVRYAGREPELEVALDGKVMPMSIGRVGSTFPVDPGEHELVVSAAGRVPWSQRLTIAAGPSQMAVDVPALVVVPVAPVSPIDAPPPEKKPSAASRTVGFVALGIGIAGLGIGAFTGLRAFGNKSDADAECDARGCSRRGLDLYDDAQTNATLSTVAFSVGVVALVTSAYFLFGPPSRSKP